MIKTIYMGQIDTVRSPDTLKTTLGSCVGVVLYDPQSDTFGMAHIMLPDSQTRTIGSAAPVGKFANTAIPALMAKMGTTLDQASRLRAKAAGGANMFPEIRQEEQDDVLRVGERNSAATLELLKTLGIRILGTDLGGSKGRELSIDAKTGKIWVRNIGSERREL